MENNLRNLFQYSNPIFRPLKSTRLTPLSRTNQLSSNLALTTPRYAPNKNQKKYVLYICFLIFFLRTPEISPFSATPNFSDPLNRFIS